MDAERTSLSFEQVLVALRRGLPWVVLCVVAVAGAAYAFSKQQPKKYTATATLAFNNNQLSQQVAGLQTAGGNETQQVQENTNVKLVQLGDMAALTAHRLGQGLTADKVKEDLSVTGQGESTLVSVTATSSSPTLTAAIANTYSKRFVLEQQSSFQKYYRRALALVNKRLAALSPLQRTGATGLALENRAQSLGVLAELQTGTVQVAQPATAPTSPSSPDVRRNTILGGVLGLLLGLAVAFLFQRFDRRIREPDDLAAIYHLPLLGVVPKSRALARPARRKRGERVLLPPEQAEVFNLIRAHLRFFNVDRQVRTLLVTSATRGDGKTTIARHLAAAAAGMGSTVLLLEADLRRPVIAEKLDLAPGPGLSDVLVGSVPLWRAIQWLALELDVLVAGAAVPPNPGELIESDAMEALLEQVGSTYDLVVVDTPPLAVLSDAFPLLRKVDGVVVVGWVGRNRRDVAERLRETLIGAGAPLLGVIANRCRAGRFTSQPYGYAYGRDEPSAGVTTSSPDGADSYMSSAPGEIGASSDPDFWVEPSTSDRPGGGVGSPNGHEAEPLGRLQQE